MLKKYTNTTMKEKLLCYLKIDLLSLLQKLQSIFISAVFRAIFKIPQQIIQPYMGERNKEKENTELLIQ